VFVSNPKYYVKQQRWCFEEVCNGKLKDTFPSLVYSLW